ncbi:MAG: cytochrome c oxidase accessory protein FixG [Cryomorphaceae bacterium]|jgi:cytochrome c oxidase accessory protein FixG
MEVEKVYQEDSFRDSMSTIDESGKRKWLFPKKPAGYFTKWRTWVSYILLAFLFLAPFVRISGQPLLQFNLLERKFIILGQIFWPQDFHLFVLAMITLVIFVTLFTVVYGRLFCGWVCPQTIFMEHVFRKIEYAIDGTWKEQMRLKKSGWTKEKVRKRVLKHVIFFAISFLIANTFLAYIIGSDALLEIVTEPFGAHIGGLAAITVFSGVFYGVFAFFREQVCIAVCPYGRLQGAMLDRQSVVVAYDYSRGETRGKIRKNEERSDAGKGDCIDCGHCVHVCPTGIDIRNGTQLECINCTACIDACDEMMEAVNLPKGLIRYTSEDQISTGKPFTFSTRAKAYTAVLAVLVAVVVTLLVTRTEVEAIILRTPGMLFQKNDDGTISNLYSYKIINKTNFDIELTIEPLEEGYSINMIGDAPSVAMQEVAEGAFFLSANPDLFDKGKSETKVAIYDQNGELLEKIKMKIMGPL